jgi:uncharacterized protein YndB with AHSA1/START domain
MDQRHIQFGTIVRTEPGRVFDAFATAGGLDGWFTTGAEVDARPGGVVIFRWKDWGVERIHGESRGEVLAADRPGRFAFQWQASFDDPQLVTTVELTFSPEARGTAVLVREGPFPGTPAGLRAMLSNASGWGEALTLMKFYVEHGLRH